MKTSDATGADSRYVFQSRGQGERMTSSPSLRMNTSSVENWYSFGSRTAWLRLVMKTLAVRGMATGGPPAAIMPYTSCIWRTPGTHGYEARTAAKQDDAVDNGTDLARFAGALRLR